jgi:hypothetical protein
LEGSIVIQSVEFSQNGADFMLAGYFTATTDYFPRSITPPVSSILGGDEVKISGNFPKINNICCEFDGVLQAAIFSNETVVACKSPAMSPNIYEVRARVVQCDAFIPYELAVISESWRFLNFTYSQTGTVTFRISESKRYGFSTLNAYQCSLNTFQLEKSFLRLSKHLHS